MISANEEYIQYIESLKSELTRLYSVASEARKLGFDPSDEVEIKIAKDVASRVEALVGPPGISKIIREMETEAMSHEDIAFALVEKIVKGEIISTNIEKINANTEKSIEKRIEQAVRTSIGILTEGMLVAPTEGISKLKLKTNPDGTSYIAIYFTGPIRSAGGTIAALAVALADYARKIAGIGDYRATDSEIERYVEEINIYEIRVLHLQYKPRDDDIRWIIKNCPVCIDGEPTEDTEVSIYRNLPRIETNRIRGGVPLVICEGIAQKSTKVYKISKKFGLNWDWIEKLIKIKQKESTIELKPDWTYLEGLVAGRPVFAYPMTKGGFRIRYGKSRTNGLMAKSVHPATMVVLNDFLALGTHIKIERPGKGAVLSSCDEIEPPIVKLKNGSVIKIRTVEKARELLPHIEKVLFLGDILITYGDFLKSGHPLIPCGWCEEWWIEECRAKNIHPKKFESAKEAFEFSRNYSVPLHPNYVYFWHDINTEQIKQLVQWLSLGTPVFDSGEMVMFILQYLQQTFDPKKEVLEDKILEDKIEDKKEILEELGVEHNVAHGKIFLGKDDAYVLFATLGLELSTEGKISTQKFDLHYADGKSPFAIINDITGIEIKAKAPIYIGCRMGRPEKAKERAMEGDVNVLFPTRSPKNRSLIKLYKTMKNREGESGKNVYLEIARFVCPNCRNITQYRKCELCNTKTVAQNTCPKCGAHTNQSEHCGPTLCYDQRAVNVVNLIEMLKKQYNNLPEDIRGIKGLSNRMKIPERLEKGLFRARHNVTVFRDGTCRFDATDIPLTYFKPKEIATRVEKLRSLGYTKDYLGDELLNDEQIIPLKPQDIVISVHCAEYFLRVAKFIDDMLIGLYNMQSIYNVQKREDLLGHLFIGLSPHTSSGVLVRVIGFTKASVGFGHPYFHAAKRRNCDGDEDSIILLMDALLNFSRFYLSSIRGGTMDAPITLSTVIDPKEVDDEVHNLELVSSYPLDFYRAAEKYCQPGDVKIKTVKDALSKPEQYEQLGFTHNTKCIEEGCLRTAYVSLKSIPEKINMQFNLQKRLRPINIKDIAEKLILSHFIPDLYGNLRSFSRQTFRCSDCNEIYRRTPLAGKCVKCGGKLLLTINKGGIKKYLEISCKICNEYDLPGYIKQRLDLIKKEIESIFEDEKIKQMGIEEFL
ncbi:MAG: DNA polymerase II large subunit [Candidatus Micrarchaeota archaeon]